MPYASSGTLTTDKREVAISETWDSQSDWEAYQSASNVQINSGVVSLAEVTVPAQEDLFAWYDATAISASDGDSVSTWTDSSGNGRDLTAGNDPTYTTDALNGNPVVRFDGVDDYLDTGVTNQSQPNHVFIVGTFRDASGRFFQSTDGDARNHFDVNNGNWAMYAGSGLENGTADSDPHVFSALFNEGSSVMRIDGTQTATGSLGTESMGGIRLGANVGLNDFGAIDAAEVLVYPSNRDDIQTDVEQYLSDKWGVTLA